MTKKNLAKILSILNLLLFVVSTVNAKIPDSVLKQKKAVVTIYINDKDGNQIATGSGFIIDPNGIIATNYHIVSKWLEVDNTILFKMENGSFYPVEALVSFDEDNDVALLKVTGKELSTIKLGTGYKAKQGGGVVVIGSPLGLETTVSDGIISSIRGKEGIIQITAPISPGSSGSPVFNLKGEVIGIATFQVRGGQNLNFAIPIRYIAKLLHEYKTQKNLEEEWEKATPIKQKQTGRYVFEANPREAPAPAPAPAPSPAPESATVEVSTPETLLEKAKAKLKKNPDDAEAHFALGLALYKLDMKEEAAEAYRQAIRLKPDYFEAHLELAHVYASQGKAKQAIKTFKQAIRLQPDNKVAHSELLLACFISSMYEECTEEWKQQINDNPDKAIYYVGLGYAYDKLGLNKEAMEAFKHAIKLDPEDSFQRTYFGLGVAYSKMGLDRKAIEAFKQAIKVQPDLAQAHCNLAVTYSRLRMYKEAVEAFKQAIRLQPDLIEAHYNLGVIYSRVLNEIGSALEEYKILKKLAPGEANELFNQIYK